MARQDEAFTMTVDAGPLRLFIELFRRAVKGSGRHRGLGYLPDELARVEVGDDAAGARGLTMTVYPSDRFMCFAAAALAGDVDPGVVEDAEPAQPERAIPNVCPPSDAVR